MKTRPRWALGIALLILLACAQGIAPDATLRAEAPRLEFVEQLTGSATANETLPLLIVLHGLGDRPEAFLPLFAHLGIKARVIAPRAPDPWHGGSSWYPIDDEKNKPRIIKARAQQVADLIAHLTQSRPTVGKPVITGFSQGGVLSFAMAALYPDLLRAALPMAGQLPKGIAPSPKPPAGFDVFAFHGTADKRIPFAEGERAVLALSAQGYAASMQAFEGAGHAIPPAMQAALFSTLQKTLGRAAHQGNQAQAHVTAEEVRSIEASPRKNAPNGKAAITLLAEGDNAFMGKLEMVAGAAVPEHQDPTEEYIHVLSGHGTLTMNGKAYPVAPGTTIFMPAYATVSFQNGNEPFVGIQVFAGPGPAKKYDAWQ